MTQLPLPLFRKIIFVDWHGVLSGDLFWSSILSSKTHPLRAELSHKLSRVFSNYGDANRWMRGKVSSEEVIAQMGIPISARFNETYMSRRLDEDCSKMQVDAELAGYLKTLRSNIPIILATDNIDTFSRRFERARKQKMHWTDLCDDIICSSDIGVLKAEDPAAFFGPMLGRYGLNFRDALLIDDRLDNCKAFANKGGGAVQWCSGVTSVKDLDVKVREWLRQAPVFDS